MRFADNRKYFEEVKQFEEANRWTVSSCRTYPIEVSEYTENLKMCREELEPKKKGKRGKNGSI